jgi:hypothetical protein
MEGLQGMVGNIGKGVDTVMKGQSSKAMQLFKKNEARRELGLPPGESSKAIELLELNEARKKDNLKALDALPGMFDGMKGMFSRKKAEPEVTEAAESEPKKKGGLFGSMFGNTAAPTKEAEAGEGADESAESEPKKKVGLFGSMFGGFGGKKAAETAGGEAAGVAATDEPDAKPEEADAVDSEITPEGVAAAVVLSPVVMKWMAFGIMALCAFMGFLFLVSVIVKLIKKRKINRFDVPPIVRKTRDQRVDEERRCKVT